MIDHKTVDALEMEAKKNNLEAQHVLGMWILNGRIPEECGVHYTEEYALALLCSSANQGFLASRIALNRYCEKRYQNSIEQNEVAESGPLCDFDGKRIRIDRKGLFVPVDACLEYKDGKNILTFRFDVNFLYIEDIPNRERFEEAVLSGIRLWQGEYQVFGGQQLTVKMDITTEGRLFDCIPIIPITKQFREHMGRSAGRLQSQDRKEAIEDALKYSRSFMGNLGKWSVRSRKLIYILSPQDDFSNYEEIRHVAKHEFGHVLGLGDLYEEEGKLPGVPEGSFPETDSYHIIKQFYNLVMCDHHGPISNNDIEMVVLAFSENRAQNYQPGAFGEEVSKALGKGN